MKLVYNFKKNTGEYINSSQARIDPLETKKQGKPIYLLPGFATFDKPPIAKKNEVAVFREGKWEKVIDKRGISYWDENNIEYIISDIETDIPPMCSLKPRPDENYIMGVNGWEFSIVLAKENQCQKISEAFNLEIEKGVSVTINGIEIVMDVSVNDSRNLTMGLANADGPMSIVDKQNGIHENISLSDVENIIHAQEKYYLSNWNKKITLRKKIIEAKSKKDVLSVIW